MPKVLIEKSNTLSYIKEDLGDNKHYLGKLAGIGGTFNSPTRNGRRYPLELWKNIQNSEDFKEGMETHTIFGECDHPEERVETSIKEIAIVLTKFEIRESEGNIYTEFHILDTPNGRILKELLDYGSQIGVSTRGLGDEVVKDGETIIDPSTYVFYGWDAVIMPAVKSARPSVVESKKVSLIESFNKEINSADVSQLESMKRMVSKLPELDSLTESINIKLDSMKSSGDNISQKLEEDLGRISEENVSLTEQIEDLKSKLSANNIRLTRLYKSLESYKETVKSLRKRLQHSMSNASNLEREAYNSAVESKKQDEYVEAVQSKLEDVSNDLNNSRIECVSMRSKLKESEDKLNRALAENRKLSAKLEKSSKNLDTSGSEIRELKRAINELRSENNKLTEQINSNNSKKIITEQRSKEQISSYKKALTEKNSVISQTTEKYLKTVCAQNGLKVETVSRLLPKDYSIDDIDKVVQELADRKRRYDALPFAIPVGSNARILENNSNMSDEDRQTMEFLKESFKNN